MEQVIVAFERESNAKKIKETLESAGVAACIICRSTAEVKRLVYKMNLSAIICGFKLSDGSCESLRSDLPDDCAMLMVAVQGQLEMVEGESLFKLAAPMKKSDLLDSVRMLLQLSHGVMTGHRHRRTEEEQNLVEQAKRILMGRHGMTEGEAHRFLQKRSMDNGIKLTDTARMVLTEE